MAPCPRWSLVARGASLALAAAAALASPAAALRIVNYNITNYPGLNGAGRDPHFRTVLAPLGAELVVVQEMHSDAGVSQFLGNLNALEPGQWSAAPFFDGNDTNNALFYKPSRLSILGAWAWYPPEGSGTFPLRYVNCWRVKPAGYDRVELRIYSVHLKASQGSSNEQQRLAEAIGIRDSMNQVPPGTHSILLGDFNCYNSSEPAFQKLLESQADNDGRVYDPLNAVGNWHDGAAFAAIHTQSPCRECPSGFATGGIDDRFDMFLPTLNLGDGEGLDLLAATYRPVGNDGQHLNLNITDPPVIPEGSAYATALWSASDHFPIRVDVQLPARIAVASSLAFGSIIESSPQSLLVSNAATAPADELTYQLGAPPGFTAPAGTFAAPVGSPAASHAIDVAPGAPGPRSGNLVVSSDDPDHPSRTVSLTATVHDHAVPSLDSASVSTAASLDFGDRPAGGFDPQPVRVHNQGYHAYRARLAVNGAAIAGGAGRFSLPGGFDPALLAGTGASYAVAFDDAGATPDSTYQAVLTFSSADEPLPGGSARPDLTVALRARVVAGTAGVAGGVVPAATRLLPPHPNPLTGAGTLRFELARPATVRLEVFDLSGRRLALLADRSFAAGRHGVDWDGRADDGRAAEPGLYFVRLSAAGGAPQTARLAIVR